MEEQQFISVSSAQRSLRRHLQLDCVDVPDPLMQGAGMVLTYAYLDIPDPPVSPAAPLASAVAARAPADGVDRISLLPDALLRNVVSRLPANDPARAPADGVGRISLLPDALLRNVVSRLPAKDAARTAAFATRWRGLWRSVPLSVVDAHILPRWISADRMMPGGEDLLSRAVAVTASRVLNAHPGPFRCVHLSRCHMASHHAEIERWLKLLAAKSVQELVFLNRPWPIDHPLPQALYGCTSITRLHLGLCSVPSTTGLPRATRFPHLEELILSTVVIREGDLNFLIDRSPVLAVLTISANLTGVFRLRLISRSLRCVQVSMYAQVDITVVYAPRLERLHMWMISPAIPSKRCSKIKIDYAPNLCMLGHCRPGFELEIDNTIHKLQAGTKMSPSTMVQSVKILALEVEFEIRNEVKMMPCFLKCFPNVETLHVFSVNGDPIGKFDPKFWKGKEAGCIVCVQRHVKKFVFQEFHGKRSELAFLKFIAERAQVLEKMVVMVSSKCFSSAGTVNAKLKPLTSAIWANKDCKLIVFKSRSSDGASPAWSSKVASNFSFSDPFDLLTFSAELNSGAYVLQHSRALGVSSQQYAS